MSKYIKFNRRNNETHLFVRKHGLAASTTPIGAIGLSSGVKAISVGNDHTCAITSSGIGKCWGYNHLGQLGVWALNNNPTPVDVMNGAVIFFNISVKLKSSN